MYSLLCTSAELGLRHQCKNTGEECAEEETGH